MRAVHINTTTTTGGTAQVATTLCREQSKLGADVSLVSRETLKIPKLPNLLAYRLTGRDGVFSRWNAFLASDLYRSADVIHMHNAHGYYMPLEVIERMLVKPLVWTLHDFWILTGRCAMPEDCTGYLSGCAPCPHKNRYPASHVDRAAHDYRVKERLRKSKAVFVSPSHAARVLDAHVIPNPVQIELPTRDRGAYRRELGLPQDKRIAVFAARKVHEPRKGYLTFAKAIDGLDIHPVVIGEGGQFGLLSREAVAGYFRAADYVCVPSVSETFGLTYAEGIVAGAAVIAADIPVAREVLGIYGRFHQSGDHGELRRLLSEPPAYPSPSQQNEMVERYAPASAARKYLALYEQAIAGIHKQ